MERWPALEVVAVVGLVVEVQRHLRNYLFGLKHLKYKDGKMIPDLFLLIIANTSVNSTYPDYCLDHFHLL